MNNRTTYVCRNCGWEGSSEEVLWDYSDSYGETPGAIYCDCPECGGNCEEKDDDA